MSDAASLGGDRPGRRIRIWLDAARPRTLPAAFVPVLVGTAASANAGAWRPETALLALASMLLLQVGTNFLNDWGDARRGADGEDRIGPIRAVQSGLLSREAMLGGALVAFASACAIGLLLVARGGWPILVAGLIGLLAGAGYTAGPYPFAYHALGEVVVFVAFGPLAVCATEWLQRGAVSAVGAIASVAVGLLASAILVVNNLRDIESDRRVGKYTIAVALGAPAMRFVYVGLLGAAACVPLLLASGGFTSGRVLISWGAFPLAVEPLRAVFGPPDGPTLNAALAATARFLLVFGGLLSLGLVAG